MTTPDPAGPYAPPDDDGPLHPPYPGPFDVPVLVDSVKHLDDFEMTRCTFYTIEPTATVDDWVADLRSRNLPFLLMGIAPVLHRPDLGDVSFRTAEQITDLFSSIESVEGLVVETADIWLPNFLLPGGGGDRVEDPVRGDVLRVAFALFQRALQFRHELIATDVFVEECRRLQDSAGGRVQPSPNETAVFRDWSASQFDDAVRHYVEQRADPGRGVLRWRDAQGLTHAG